jgi:hypothetical protein
MNKEVITSTSFEGRPLAAGETVHYCSVKEISKTGKATSEEDEAVLNLVRELAANRGLKFQVIDVASLNGKLKARLNGIKATPTIIVGNNRLIGVPKKEEFEALLKRNQNE